MPTNANALQTMRSFVFVTKPQLGLQRTKVYNVKLPLETIFDWSKISQNENVYNVNLIAASNDHTDIGR